MIACLLVGLELIMNLFKLFSILGNTFEPMSGGISAPRGGRVSIPLSKVLLPLPSLQGVLFFFVKHPLGDWRLESLGTLRCPSIRAPALSKEEKVQYEALLHFEIPMLRVLLSNKTLFEVGLSWVWPRGVRRASILCLSSLYKIFCFCTSNNFVLYIYGSLTLKKLKWAARLSQPSEFHWC